MPWEYAELGVQSAFSFLNGASQPEDLIDNAARLNLQTLALSDFGGVYGSARMHQAACQAGLRAIVGAQIDIPPLGRVRLLCQNLQGYQNLCYLLTVGHRNYPKGKCEISPKTLLQHTRGLIALVAPSHDTTMHRTLAELCHVFAPQQLFIELHRHYQRQDNSQTTQRLHLAQALKLPVVATNDVRHSRKADKPLHDILTCIRHRTQLDHIGRRLLPNDERCLKNGHAMAQLFADIPEAIHNTQRIAERCDFTLKNLGYRFPVFPCPDGLSAMALLRQLTFKGAKERYHTLSPKVRKQLEHELGMIDRLELPGYFLIVWDIVRFAKEHHIMAQGRGSAANSAVCYSLGITAVDPVGMELLFERFLSEERGEWPDIDIDLPSGQQREQVIQYVYQTYGHHGAAMTANVITYRDRLALREVGKALGFDPRSIDRAVNIGGYWGHFPDLQAMSERMGAAGLDPKEARVHHWIELSQRLINTPRHLGQHSGGMVIAAGRLDHVVPIEPASMPGRSVIQWDKDDCSALGIIKVDLLGLGMLQVLQDAVPLIAATEGHTIDYAKLPANDKKVFDMLCAADTVGVFQVESRAQMATLPRLKPRCFYDLVVEIALIRPGPVVGQMVHPYLKRRSGKEAVTYLHPTLEPILKRTLGIPLFQEQLLRMAMAVGGFSAGEAEELRRALGFKRSIERMHSIEEKLRRGMQRMGIAKESQDAISKSITAFALYGFPESHSASFALIAYASTYLKAHHPAAFLCALLNAYPMGFYHPATLIKDAQRHGVRMHPIDITLSHWQCTLDDKNTVRLGLSYVQGLKQAAAQRLLHERQQQSFISLVDFERRVQLGNADLQNLAEVGAFAPFGKTRRQALWQVANLKERSAGVLGTIHTEDTSAPLPEMSLTERVIADFKTTQVSAGPHPMAFMRQHLHANATLSAHALKALPHGKIARTAGLVRVRQRPMTAKGFFFITLEDETGHANIILTPKMFENYRSIAVGAVAMWAEGVVQNQDNVVHLKCTRIEALEARFPKNTTTELSTWGSRYG